MDVNFRHSNRNCRPDAADCDRSVGHRMKSHNRHPPSRRPLYEMLGLPPSVWWVHSLITWTEPPAHSWLEVTLGSDAFKAILVEKDGIQIWAKLMAHWQEQDDFLCGYDPTRDHEPAICLTLDFADADFTNLFLAGVDLRFAWLNRADFSGASLECAMFDCSHISATDFSKAQMVGASFLYCMYHPEHPPRGLCQEVMAHYGVTEDPAVPFD